MKAGVRGTQSMFEYPDRREEEKEERVEWRCPEESMAPIVGFEP
jgi:hypothetical protein